MNTAPSTPCDAGEPGPAEPAAAAPGPATSARPSRALLTMVIDIVVPIAVFYGVRGAGGSVWLALALGAVAPAASAVAGLVRGRRPDAMGVMILATLALSAGLSLLTGSPRVLLARDGLLTGAWAAYMYLSLLARRPATFVVSRPLLEGRRVYDPAQRRWVRPAARTWDEMWEQVPRFRSIWRVCTSSGARPSWPTRWSGWSWPTRCRSGWSRRWAGRCGRSRSSCSGHHERVLRPRRVLAHPPGRRLTQDRRLAQDRCLTQGRSRTSGR